MLLKILFFLDFLYFFSLPPLWPLLLQQSSIPHRFWTEATLTVMSHRYTMSALPQPSHWDGVLFPSTHYGSSDSAIISHVLYGRTISIWLNVSFVVGGNNDDPPISKESNEYESTSTPTSTSSSTSSTNNNNYNNKKNNNDGNEYTLEGVARKVVNEVRNILASAQIQKVTAKNSVHMKEYNYVYVPGYDLQQQKNNNKNTKEEKKNILLTMHQ